MSNLTAEVNMCTSWVQELICPFIKIVHGDGYQNLVLNGPRAEFRKAVVSISSHVISCHHIIGKIRALYACPSLFFRFQQPSS